MVPKRHFVQEEGVLEAPLQESKRRFTLATAVKEVIRGNSMQEFLSNLEPFLRRVVREEVERCFLRYVQPSSGLSLNQIEVSESRSWRLQFVNRLPQTIFTGSRVEAEDYRPLQIVILDASSNNIITTGPLSSIKVEILVLDGDFGTDEREDWSEKEFDANVIREREGKRPLVTGEVFLTLSEGIGYLGEITFTDNSSWIRSRKFRLGVKSAHRNCGAERIREARSEAFVVKDHRGELYKKHHPPSLHDEIWRLERIGKDGAFHTRLAASEINTVQDFMRLLVTDSSSLRKIFGSGMSNRTWEQIIQHARDCVLDDKLYMYYSSDQHVGILLNSIYYVVGVTFDGQNYKCLNNLTSSEMILVDALKRQAYKNVNNIIEIDEPLAVGPSRPMPRLGAPSLPGPSLDMQHSEFAITHQDQLTSQLNINHPTNQPQYVMQDHYPLEGPALVEGSHPIQAFTPVQRNSFNLRDFCSGPYRNDVNEWSLTESPGPFLSNGNVIGDGISHVQFPGWFQVAGLLGQGNGLFDETGINFLSSLPELDVRISKNCKPNLGWLKLRAAVKWGISLRAQRRDRLLQYSY